MADRYEVTFIRAWRIVDTMAQVMVEEHFELFFVARCFASSKFLTGLSVKKIVNMEPTRCTTTGTLY